MTKVTCDQCLVPINGNPPIHTRGLPRKSGILLPDQFVEHDFCSAACFWQFVVAQMPEPLKNHLTHEHNPSTTR